MSAAPAPAAGQGPADSLALEFCDPSRGLFGLVRAERGMDGAARALGALLEAGREPILLAAEAATSASLTPLSIGPVHVELDGPLGRAALESADGGFQVDFEAGGDLPAALDLAAPAGFSQQATLGVVRGEIIRNGSRIPFSLRGRAVRTLGRPDWERLSMLRSVAAYLDDERVLCLAAARATSAQGHGEEALAASVAGPETVVAVPHEAFLSTEYGERGEHRRAGLELWFGEESPPMRAAGTLIGAGSTTMGELDLTLALFRWSSDGHSGAGPYEITRRRAEYLP